MLPLDAETSDVIQYAKDAKADWHNQRDVDDDNRDMYLQKHVVKVTDPDRGSRTGDTNQDIEPIGLGRGSLMVDQDVHLISVMWTHRVNPAGTDSDAQKHASKLEKFLDASTLRMEELAPVPQMPKLRKEQMKRKPDIWDLVALVGLLTLGYGVFLWSVPVGVVFVGVVLLLFGAWGSWRWTT